MTKIEYLKQLKRALKPITRAECEKSLAYFSEVIDDRMEEGISEETAVSELESVEAAAERIIAEASAQGQLRAHRSIWEIILIVLGFPVWFPLLLAISIVVLTVYGLVWIIIAAIFIVSAALAVSGIAGVIGLIILLVPNTAAAFAVLGVGLVCAGLGVAIFVPALYMAKAYASVTPVMWNKLKSRKVG